MKKYKIIYADPPWSYKNYNYSETKDGSRAKRGCRKEYELMSIDEIKALPVKDLADDNCILFIWVTWPLLQEGIDTIKAWGFDYKTIGFVWVKTNKLTNPNQTSFLPYESFDSFWGMGNWTRSNSEICLIGVKGKPIRNAADVHSVLYSPIGKHSKKPNEVRDRIIKLCGDIPKLEMFARQAPDGWDVFGNQVKNSIKLYL